MPVSDFWPTLEKQLIVFRDVSNSIRIHLVVYEKECIELIKELSNTSFEESQTIFDRLEALQSQLSCAKHVYGVDLKSDLVDFIYAFDRIFEMDTRTYWYKKLYKKFQWPLKH